jgi:putative lipoic acid-binding regulatory protein
MSDQAHPQKAELEFPLDFTYKIIVDPTRVVETQLLQIITSLISRINPVLKTSSRPSKAGKYLAHTLVVKLESRTEMESLYEAFKQLEGVVYML